MVTFLSHATCQHDQGMGRTRAYNSSMVGSLPYAVTIMVPDLAASQAEAASTSMLQNHGKKASVTAGRSIAYPQQHAGLLSVGNDCGDA